MPETQIPFVPDIPDNPFDQPQRRHRKRGGLAGNRGNFQEMNHADPEPGISTEPVPYRIRRSGFGLYPKKCPQNALQALPDLHGMPDFDLLRACKGFCGNSKSDNSGEKPEWNFQS